MLESHKMVKRKAKRNVYNSDKVPFYLGPKSAKKATGRRQESDRKAIGRRQAANRKATSKPQ